MQIVMYAYASFWLWYCNIIVLALNLLCVNNDEFADCVLRVTKNLKIVFAS